MNRCSILIVDDDESLRRVMEFVLSREGHDTTAAESATRAIDLLRESEFDLLVTDMKMPSMDGIELMLRARELRPRLPVILVTAFGTIERAVEAIKLGAYDYIAKPFDNDDFLHRVSKALEFGELQKENEKLKAELDSQETFGSMIGNSDAMQRIFATVRKISGSDATVLINGESGTGKELVARAIHKGSDRKMRPMITVNCAAIPKELLESELFGHVKGAFTGAVRDKTGKFLAADRSTIFLDEIGDMNLELQAKLLRVIEDRIVEPVGGEKSIPVDIRILAATNRPLDTMVREGDFRDDLFYRLNVIPINIPPLRERKEDIPLLLAHFLRRFAPEKELAFDNKATDLLEQYSWPGNVRELENIVKRVVVLSKGKVIRVSDLPELIQKGKERPETGMNSEDSGKVMTLIESEKKLIIDALTRSGWNQTKASRLLGIPRHVLVYRLKKYGIKEA